MHQNNDDKILRNFTLLEFDMKLDPNSELGENLVATAASAGEAEGMAESSDILNLPASVTCALSCPSDYIHTDAVLMQGLPITLCPEPSSFYSTAPVAYYRNLCPMNVSTVSQIKHGMNYHVFRCQQLTSVTTEPQLSFCSCCIISLR